MVKNFIRIGTPICEFSYHLISGLVVRMGWFICIVHSGFIALH